MITFKTNKISYKSDYIGQQLRQTRQTQNISLEEVSKKLNINLKYLAAIENGQLNKLPAGIYKKNFLREYAQFLKMNPTELLESFNSEIKSKPGEKKNLFTKKIPHFFYFLAIPKIIKNIIILIIALTCLAYLIYCIGNIISPPKLTIINPPENLTTNKYVINVLGLTEPEAEITINGETISINTNGYFTKKISLKNGLNTIYITAQKKYSRRNNMVRNILVKDNNKANQ